MVANKLGQVKMDFPPSVKYAVVEVLNGEYDLPLKIKRPIIFDIGANVGSFAVWAAHRWPGSTIHCYEPSPSSFEYLKKNLESYKNVILNNVAVGDPKRIKLYQGMHSCTSASFFQLGEQTSEYELVTTIGPGNLPKKCDLLKIDTEGCELEILKGLKQRQFVAILIEYHSETDRRKIDAMLHHDYILAASKAHRPHLGLLKYLHKSLLASYLKQYKKRWVAF